MGDRICQYIQPCSRLLHQQELERRYQKDVLIASRSPLNICNPKTLPDPTKGHNLAGG
jgi:hypothetical protein